MSTEHDSIDTLPMRFAFGGKPGEVLHRHARLDVASARLSWKFKLYYRLRPWIPLFLRQKLQRGRNGQMQVAENWYLPKTFEADFLEALALESKSSLVLHPWPDGFTRAACMTHDVETSTGVGMVDRLAAIEEQLGFRSAWYFIPHRYKVDPGLLSDLRARGHEIGIHGYNHDGRLFESHRTFDRRAGPINAALKRLASVGFRAPMVHRNLAWQQALDIDYDASCFDIDPFQAMPGGVGGPWPFIAGKFVELPYTLPQDHTLLIALRESSARIWIDKFDYLKRLSGMAMLITHPDYLDIPERLDVYRQWLEYLAEQKDCWSALPSQIATWWRQRDALSIANTGSAASAMGVGAERASIKTFGQLFGQVLAKP